jgi:succinyl-diaminopimelate desuccinylase
MAEGIIALRGLDAPPAHPALGTLTTNVGTIAGGQQTNLVPDLASMTIDIRTVPGQDAEAVISLLEETTGGQVTEILRVPSVWTDPHRDVSQAVAHTIMTVTGTTPGAEGVSYFTDGAVLADPSSAAVFIVGPGGVDQPHTSDESCSVARIVEAVRIYRALLSG